MRKIKFRVWNNKTQEYDKLWVDAITPEGDMISICDEMVSNLEELVGEDVLIIEQFTGLLDKNGKEIYEGDIVNAGGSISAVCFELTKNIHSDQDGMRYVDISIKLFSGNGHEWKNMTVIGNIHENPELLEAT